MNKALKYAFGAIAIYLIVNNFTGSGFVINNATKGSATVIRAFQGQKG